MCTKNLYPTSSLKSAVNITKTKYKHLSNVVKHVTQKFWRNSEIKFAENNISGSEKESQESSSRIVDWKC